MMSALTHEHIRDLEHTAKNIRRTILEIIFRAKSSHIGCSLSAADILTALYFNVMKIDPRHPQKDDRDRLVMSKGHAVSGLYAALAERGFFPQEKLKEYGTEGTNLASHVVRGSVPGTETSNGSGGHGLSLGVGIALALRNKKNNTRVFVLSGDGELQEGSVWEALLSGATHVLDNLTLIVDRNRFQDGQDGNGTDQILALEPLDKKFEAFGWETETIDGHSFIELIPALMRHSKRPRVIIANTIKAKGVPFMEGRPEWHGKCPDEDQYNLALKELAH